MWPVFMANDKRIEIMCMVLYMFQHEMYYHFTRQVMCKILELIAISGK